MTKSEMIVSKVFSAKFLISIIVTLSACLITWKVIGRYPEHAGAVITGFMTTWMSIVKDYFQHPQTSVPFAKEDVKT